MTFILTWFFWIIAFNSANIKLNGTFRIIGSFVPSFMAMITSACIKGADGVKKLLRKLIIWKVNPLFYLFIFLYTVASLYIPSFLCNILGYNYKIHINNFISSFKLTSPSAIIICFFAVMIFGGPLGEEIGWRGYLLPELQKSFNPIISSIILGSIWTCWHIPMFYFHVPGYDINFIYYLLETIWLTILLTWLYNNTKGSLLIIILYHSIDNFVMSVCFNDFMKGLNAYTVVFWILRLIVLFFILLYMYRNPVKDINVD